MENNQDLLIRKDQFNFFKNKHTKQATHRLFRSTYLGPTPSSEARVSMQSELTPFTLNTVRSRKSKSSWWTGKA